MLVIFFHDVPTRIGPLSKECVVGDMHCIFQYI